MCSNVAARQILVVREASIGYFTVQWSAGRRPALLLEPDLHCRSNHSGLSLQVEIMGITDCVCCRSFDEYKILALFRITILARQVFVSDKFKIFFWSL